MKEKNNSIVNISIIFMIISIIFRILNELSRNDIVEFNMLTELWANSYVAAFLSMMFSSIAVGIAKNKKERIKPIVMLILNIILVFVNVYLFFNRLLEQLQILGSIG